MDSKDGYAVLAKMSVRLGQSKIRIEPVNATKLEPAPAKLTARTLPRPNVLVQL